MCHTVNTTADINSQSNRVLRTRRSAANDHWAFLRRHYLSRSTKSQVERMSRKVAERKLTKNSVVCKMVPEQKCERKRVNPRRIEKKMRKTHCREPKKNSIFDQMMVAKLTTRNPWNDGQKNVQFKCPRKIKNNCAIIKSHDAKKTHCLLRSYIMNATWMMGTYKKSNHLKKIVLQYNYAIKTSPKIMNNALNK